MIRCKNCGKTIETTEADNPLFVEEGVCLQCGVELSLDVRCEVCSREFSLSDLGVYLGHFVCPDCSIEDLVKTVKVECQICGESVALKNSCVFRTKPACRDCGIRIMRGEVDVPRKRKTGKFLKWFGLKSEQK
jgi:hypothetical protein